MKIDVIGSGSAFSKVNNTSAILIKDNDENQWLIDCGPTVPRAVWQRGIDVNAIQVIFFTHIHPDHSSGLTALINHWKSFKRDRPLQIYCQREQQAPLKSLVELAIWPETELCFDIHWQDIENEFCWQHWQIETAYTQHEMANRSIRLSIANHSLFYSGDGRPTPETERLMQGVDLAFQECAAFTSLAADSSHGDYPDCLRLLARGNFNLLGLYHCFDDAIALLREACSDNPKLFVSQDGMVFDLAKLKDNDLN